MEISKFFPIRHGSRHELKIYLTFDDGPDPRYTPRVLNILAQYDVSATFFVLGSACIRYPLLTRSIVAMGHDIGCHGFDHHHPWLISARHARAEVMDGFLALRDVSGRTPRLFRPAYGRCRKAMIDKARQLNMATVLWSRTAMDWGVWGNPLAIAARLAPTRNGDILLLHDGARQKNKVDAMLKVLPGVIEKCCTRGFRFAPLHELLNIATDRLSNVQHPVNDHRQVINIVGEHHE